MHSNHIVDNDYKSLQKFLNGKNVNNKVNPWSLELATYNIMIEWISGAHCKEVDCLYRLVEVHNHNGPATNILVNAVTASPIDRPTTHT